MTKPQRTVGELVARDFTPFRHSTATLKVLDDGSLLNGQVCRSVAYSVVSKIRAPLIDDLFFPIENELYRFLCPTAPL